MITEQTFESLNWKPYSSDFLDEDFKYFSKNDWLITCENYTHPYNTYVVKLIEKLTNKQDVLVCFRGSLYSEKEFINVLDLINRK